VPQMFVSKSCLTQVENICEVGSDTWDVCDSSTDCGRCITQFEKTCEVGGDTGNVFDDVEECECRHFILLLSKVRNAGIPIISHSDHRTPCLSSQSATILMQSIRSPKLLSGQGLSWMESRSLTG